MKMGLSGFVLNESILVTEFSGALLGLCGLG
jgi:hypothetical protein